MEYSMEFVTNTRIHTPHFTHICSISSNWYHRGKNYLKYGPLNLSIRNISNDNYLVCGKDKPPRLHYIIAIKKGDKLKITASIEKGNSKKILEEILDSIKEKFTEE